MEPSSITPQELSAHLAAGGSVALIDVRSPVEFRGIHVEFAENIPLDQLDPEAVMRARNYSADEPLYIICQAGSRGKEACAKFHNAGFANVINVEGGTSACEHSGLPICRGRGVVSRERQVRIGAGSLVLGGILVGWFLHPGGFALSAFVGAGLIFAGITDSCGMGMVLAKMPWNQRNI